MMEMLTRNNSEVSPIKKGCGTEKGKLETKYKMAAVCRSMALRRGVVGWQMAETSRGPLPSSVAGGPHRMCHAL